MCRIEKMKFYVCGTKNKCLLLRKNKNRMTSFCQNRFSNPVYSKYKNDSNRKEPSTLLAYQIIFIIKREYIPKHPLNLSHKCGRRHCIIFGHLIVEHFKINASRMACHNIMKKRARLLRFQGIKSKMLFCETCQHGRTRGTKCFYNI